MRTPDQIRKRLLLLQGKLNKVYSEISDLRSECAHPNVIVTHHGDTGNYCQADDRYWKEFTCPDCGKFWNEEKK